MDQTINNKILEMKDLKVRFYYDIGTVKAVNGVNLSVNKGKSIGIVGESGCGKTITTYSILNLLPRSGKITAGEIKYKKRNDQVIDLTKLDPEGSEMRMIRGGEISMIFQEPMTAFSPVHTIGNQICEAILIHQDLEKQGARERAIELLNLVGISNPEQRVDEYPFQFSGGMRQRAMIAMALACDPQLVIADEPTSALDVTIQAQVLKLIKDMQNDLNLSLIMITHDLGVIAHMTEEVYVMYLGRVVENGPVGDIFENPGHPYTQDLLKSIPKMSGVEGKLSSIEGSVPDTYSLPSGCAFHTRCQKIIGDLCYEKLPPMTEINPGHQASCFHCKEARKNA